MDEAAGEAGTTRPRRPTGRRARIRRRAGCRCFQAAVALGDLDQVDEDVQRDQDEGRGRVPSRASPPTPRVTLRPLAARTRGSASRPGSASCSRGRSAARRRSRRRRSRGSGVGSRSGHRDRGAYNRGRAGPRGGRGDRRPEPGSALRDAGRRGCSSIAGIVGFFYSASFGGPGKVDDVFGVLAVNAWHNVLHILTGAIGLLVAGYAARQYALWLGVLYLASSPSGASSSAAATRSSASSRSTPATTSSTWCWGLLGVAAALATPRPKRAERRRRAEPGPA